MVSAFVDTISNKVRDCARVNHRDVYGMYNTPPGAVARC